MAGGARRFTQQAVDRATAEAPEWPTATITAIIPGLSTDGGLPVVTVNHHGAINRYPYLLQYTPVVGHVVALARYGGNWLIIGRPGGFPPPT